MLQWATIVLGMTAVGGATIFITRIARRPRPPLWLALGHGAFAVTGVSLLTYTVVTETVPDLAKYALGLFALAAVGGLTLFFGFHLRNKPLPIPLMAGHGVIALTALSLLVAALGRAG
jgi:hypothetical protein